MQPLYVRPGRAACSQAAASRKVPRDQGFKGRIGSSGSPGLAQCSTIRTAIPGRPPRILPAWRLAFIAVHYLAQRNGLSNPSPLRRNSVAMLPTSARISVVCNGFFQEFSSRPSIIKEAMVLTDPAGTSICPHLNVRGGITDRTGIAPARVRTGRRRPQ